VSLPLTLVVPIESEEEEPSQSKKVSWKERNRQKVEIAHLFSSNQKDELLPKMKEKWEKCPSPKEKMTGVQLLSAQFSSQDPSGGEIVTVKNDRIFVVGSDSLLHRDPPISGVGWGVFEQWVSRRVDDWLEVVKNDPAASDVWVRLWMLVRLVMRLRKLTDAEKVERMCLKEDQVRVRRSRRHKERRTESGRRSLFAAPQTEYAFVNAVQRVLRQSADPVLRFVSHTPKRLFHYLEIRGCVAGCQQGCDRCCLSVTGKGPCVGFAYQSSGKMDCQIRCFMSQFSILYWVASGVLRLRASEIASVEQKLEGTSLGWRGGILLGLKQLGSDGIFVVERRGVERRTCVCFVTVEKKRVYLLFVDTRSAPDFVPFLDLLIGRKEAGLMWWYCNKLMKVLPCRAGN